jgi:hypothetical protein
MKGYRGIYQMFLFDSDAGDVYFHFQRASKAMYVPARMIKSLENLEKSMETLGAWSLSANKPGYVKMGMRQIVLWKISQSLRLCFVMSSATDRDRFEQFILGYLEEIQHWAKQTTRTVQDRPAMERVRGAIARAKNPGVGTNPGLRAMRTNESVKIRQSKSPGGLGDQHFTMMDSREIQTGKRNSETGFSPVLSSSEIDQMIDAIVQDPGARELR